MRVFVLCTGRTGSKTFTEACKHISNYNCGHESRATAVGADRLNYPDQHIEVDNRLSWFLGALDNTYGNDTVYVHLTRNKQQVVDSFIKRWNRRGSIAKAFCEGVLKTPAILVSKTEKEQICAQYYDTVNANITHFLKDKSKTLRMDLATLDTDFPRFWELINAEGNRDKAIKTLRTKHNTSKKQNNTVLWEAKLMLLGLWRRVVG